MSGPILTLPSTTTTTTAAAARDSIVSIASILAPLRSPTDSDSFGHKHTHKHRHSLAGLPMVSSSSRPRKRLTLLDRRSNRPHTHHDHISRPFAHIANHHHPTCHNNAHGHGHNHSHLHPHQHTAHRTTTAFTPPAPHAKPRPNRRHGSFVSFRRVPKTPPPSPLVTTTFGLRLERALSRQRPVSRPGTPVLPEECCPAPASAPSTLRVPGANTHLFVSASSVSLSDPSLGKGMPGQQGQGHRRTLSNKVRTLLVGLMHRRRGEEGFDEEEVERHDDEGEGQGEQTGGGQGLTFGAPLRPHRSPGAASFHVTTKLTPTRSSSPPSRTASFVSRDETPQPHLIIRPRTRRGLRHHTERIKDEDDDDDEGDDEKDGYDYEDDDDDCIGKAITNSRPCTPLPLRSSTIGLSLRPTTPAPAKFMAVRSPTRTSIADRAEMKDSIDSSPSPAVSVYVERPSTDSLTRPSVDLRPNHLDRVVSHTSRNSLTSGGSRTSHTSALTDSARPSVDTTRSLMRTETKSTFTSASGSGFRESPSENKVKVKSPEGDMDKDGALESRFSDTSDSEDDEGGYHGLERERPTSPFRRPWSSMPDLVRDQLRALAARRGKSLELAEE